MRQLARTLEFLAPSHRLASSNASPSEAGTCGPLHRLCELHVPLMLLAVANSGGNRGHVGNTYRFDPFSGAVPQSGVAHSIATASTTANRHGFFIASRTCGAL